MRFEVLSISRAFGHQTIRRTFSGYTTTGIFGWPHIFLVKDLGRGGGAWCR